MKLSKFQDEITREPINLPRAALVFAREIAYPNLDVGGYMLRIEQLANWAGDLVPRVPHPLILAQALSDFLFQRFGFRGNNTEYSDPRNSFLNEVLDRRLGLPISLSVLYVNIANRLEIPAYGVALPGHFIVGVQNLPREIYLDPFNGGALLTSEECAQLVKSTTGYDGPFQEEWLKPTTAAEILTRMLNNLRIIFMGLEDWPASLSVLEHLRVLNPDAPVYLRDLGLIHHQNGSLRQAIHFYKSYLQHLPEAQDAQPIRYRMQAAAKQLARLN
jgi:regulator of sirC expression with transglutaminase-like and TPR domain